MARTIPLLTSSSRPNSVAGSAAELARLAPREIDPGDAERGEAAEREP